MSGEWEVISPADLREGDEIEITARAKAHYRAPTDRAGWVVTLAGGPPTHYGAEELVAMTILRAPKPEPVTLEEAMEALRHLKDVVTHTNETTTDRTAEAFALVQRYDAQTSTGEK